MATQNVWLPIDGEGLELMPTTGSLVINQVLPTSGSATGPLLLNSITATNPGLSTTGAGSWDSFGQIKNQINALRVNYATTSTNASNNGAFSVANFLTGAAESYGGALGTTINSNASTHQTWGLIGYSTVWPGASIKTSVAVEGESGISTGGSANYRIGVSANSQGPVQGSTLDAAFSASTIGNQVPGTGTSSASWQHLMALSVLYGADPASPVIATTGDFFFSEIAATVAHFANLPNVTVTGNILDFPSMAIYGNGSASFGARNVRVLLTPGAVMSTCASGGSTQIFGSADGVNGADGLLAKDSIGNNTLFAGVAEAGNTNTRFGQVTGNWGELVTLGSTNAGLMIGTLATASPQPVIIGTNNTARITISGAGAVTIPGTINGVTLDNTAWTAYSPTIASGTVGGTPATYSIVSARYKQIGKTVHVAVNVGVSNQGVGAAGSILIDLPFAASSASGAQWVGASYEYSATGKSGRAWVTTSGTTMQCRDSTSTTYIVTGNSIIAEVTYEIP